MHNEQPQELMPCPFCGNAPTLRQIGEIVGIECGNECDQTGLTICFPADKQDTAIAAWNRRAAHSHAPARAQALEEAAKVAERYVGLDAVAEAIRALSSPQTDDKAGELTGEAIAQMMHGPLLTEMGYRAMLNGDTVEVNLDYFVRFAKLLSTTRSAEAPTVAQHFSIAHLKQEIVDLVSSVTGDYEPSEWDIKALDIGLDELLADIHEAPVAQSVPEGFVLVPINPTIEMLEAAWAEEVSLSDAHTEHGVTLHVWHAMLAAAPSPDKQEGQ